MNSTTIGDKDMVIGILESCFPEAHNFKIVENFTVDDSQHFTSHIKHLEVDYELNDEHVKNYFVLKIPDRSHALISYYEDAMKFFDKEARVYVEMIPRINALFPHKIAPDSYHVTDSNILLLEDVTALGYHGVGKNHRFSLEDFYVIFESLAKFHAATYRIRRESPNVLNDGKFDVNTSPLLHARINIIDTWGQFMCALLRQNDASSLVAPFTAAMSFFRRPDDEVLSSLDNDNFEFVVLNHADFRKDNLSFKTGADGRLQDVKILDYQTCTWSSPVHDFIYLLVLSVPVAIVEKHFEALVDRYLRCLKATMLTLKCFHKYDKTSFTEDFLKSKRLLLLCLLIRASLSAPLDRKTFEESVLPDANDKIRSITEICLNDEKFSADIMAWLRYCKRVGAFDELE